MKFHDSIKILFKRKIKKINRIKQLINLKFKKIKSI